MRYNLFIPHHRNKNEANHTLATFLGMSIPINIVFKTPPNKHYGH